MTNIAFRDIAGGTINVYTANKDLPRMERIKKALEELKHTGQIIIYLHKKRKLRRIKIQKY